MPSKKRAPGTSARLRWLPRLAKNASVRSIPTGARAAAVLVVLVFVAAAMLMAARDPSSASIPAPSPATTAATSAATDVPAPNGEGKTVVPVTIIGCLEQKDDVFRLKNTEGDDAPKARSWKSGFLRKGSATVSIVDTSNRLKLSKHVGQRVSVTGTLEDREMRARSVKTIASCG